VAFFVEFVENVLDYMSQIEGLTDEDRATIVDGMIEELSRDADRFLALYSLTHESLCFRYEYAHVVQPTIFNFDFVVDTKDSAMGVVRVAYVECRVETST
jgi:hypothetical protein